MSRAARLAVAVLLLAPLTADACPPVAEKPKAIDLVVCLDVSGSMNGLIDSAKIKLWDVVNELAKVKPTPNLRVALYSYGSPQYGRGVRLRPQGDRPDHGPRRGVRQAQRAADQRRRGVRRPRHPDGAEGAEVDRRGRRPEAGLRLRQRAGQPGQAGVPQRGRGAGPQAGGDRQHDPLRPGRRRAAGASSRSSAAAAT